MTSSPSQREEKTQRGISLLSTLNKRRGQGGSASTAATPRRSNALHASRTPSGVTPRFDPGSSSHIPSPVQQLAGPVLALTQSWRGVAQMPDPAIPKTPPRSALRSGGRGMKGSGGRGYEPRSPGMLPLSEYTGLVYDDVDVDFDAMEATGGEQRGEKATGGEQRRELRPHATTDVSDKNSDSESDSDVMRRLELAQERARKMLDDDGPDNDQSDRRQVTGIGTSTSTSTRISTNTSTSTCISTSTSTSTGTSTSTPSAVVSSTYRRRSRLSLSRASGTATTVRSVPLFPTPPSMVQFPTPPVHGEFVPSPCSRPHTIMSCSSMAPSHTLPASQSPSAPARQPTVNGSLRQPPSATPKATAVGSRSTHTRKGSAAAAPSSQVR